MPDLTLQEREQVAGELRHWVRLTRRCNNRCLFCLDSVSQDGSALSLDELRRDMEAGRRMGALRLVLSGGEPTIHPRFVDVVALARSMGYQWIQVVTNGRMFAYRSFLEDCLAAGLSEVTFSMPAADPGMFARLTGTPRAFEQSLAGLRRALSSRRLVVSVDVVVSKVNLASLPEIMGFYLDLGVREFDMLQVVPFGRAFEFRDQLFFEPTRQAAGFVHRAIDLARARGAVVWTNRMDPRLLEGFEEYIQDPHKIADEVRGRREHLDALVAGRAMPCEQKERCAHCFLQGFCNHLHLVRDMLSAKLVPGADSRRQKLWLRCDVGALERAAALLAASGGVLARPVEGLWLSVGLDLPAQDRQGVASRLAAIGVDSWILSLAVSPVPASGLPDLVSSSRAPVSSSTAPIAPSGASHVPCDASADPRPEALSAWLQTILRSGIDGTLHALRLDFDMTRKEAGLVLDWYARVMGRRSAGDRDSRRDREPVVLVLTVGLVPVPVVAWMAARLPAGAVRLALPEVGSVADLDGLEALGPGLLSWIEDWRSRAGEGGTGGGSPGEGGSVEGESDEHRGRLQGSVSMAFQDVPPCLIAGAPATRGPLWLSVGALDDQGRLLPERLVEDHVRQSYRVWSARCADCPAKADCPGLPIQVARRYGLSILDPSAMRDAVGAGKSLK